MAVSLFRQEAVEFQRQRPWAGTTTAPPVATWLLTSFFVGTVALALGFLALGSYARKETVPGYLTPVAGIVKVLPPAAGTIAALRVAEGDTVRAGQPLILVRSERSSERGEPVDGAVVAHLRDKRDAIADRIELERRGAQVQRRTLEDAIAGFEAELASLRSALATQHERTRIAAELVDAVRPTVAKGFTSVTEFKRREDNRLSQAEAESDLAHQIAAKAAEAAGKRHALEEVAGKLADTLATLRSAVAETEAALAEAEAKRGYVIQAPIAGRVTTLQAWVGRAAEAGTPLLSIVPDGAELEAQLFVPARAIGFVAPGQAVRIAYDAFPFQRFGLYGGTVATVSRTLLKPSETVAPILLKEPSHRVTVRLDRQTVTAYGRELAVRPDMALTADIVFDRRSLLEWLLDPLLSARGRA